MIEFALNFSEAAGELVAARKIEIDRFKTPDWPDLVDRAMAYRPVHVHFSYYAGRRDIQTNGLEKTAALLRLTETHHVNTHIALPEGGERHNPVENVCEDILALAGRFGAENVAAENLPPYPGLSPLCHSTDFINEIIRKTGVKLLLDIGHASLAARELGEPPQRYIERLPLDRLKEIHITGLGEWPDGIVRDHMAMRDEDWEVFQWALDNISSGAWSAPSVIACEYGGVGRGYKERTNPSVIEQQIPRMLNMIRSGAGTRRLSLTNNGYL